MTMGISTLYGSPRHGAVGDQFGTSTHGGGSGCDLRAGQGSGDFRPARIGQAVGTGPAASGNLALYPVGYGSGLSKTPRENAEQTAGTQSRPSRHAAPATSADQSAERTSSRILSRLPRIPDALQRHPHAVHRRYSRRPDADLHRAHDSSRL